MAKKVVAKKKAPAKAAVKKVAAKPAVKKVVVKKAAAKPAAKKVVAKKVAAKPVVKKVESVAKSAIKTATPAKKTASKSSDKKSNDKVQKEGPKPLEKNDFLNLKIAKSMHENPPLYDYSEDEVVEHAPLTPITRETPKVGRNEPCPCGSGMKYKKCHGNI